MAKHVLQGDFSTFYWGQSYGGTQEVFLTAPLVELFGLNVAVIRAVPILLTAVAAVLVWRIGLRTVGPMAAVGAAVLFWIAPAYVIWKTTRAHGFYGSALVLTCLMLLLVLRLVERPTHRDAALLGLVLGLGWWQSSQTVTVAVPALAWLILRRPSVLRETAIIMSTAVLGAIPWVHSNLNRDWWSLGGPGAGMVQNLHAYRVHLRVFLDVHLPVLLDLRAPFTLGWTLSFLPSLAIFGVFLCGFSWLAWTRRREPVSLLIFVVLVYPFVYALSEAVWIVDEPRYVVLLTPSIALLLAWPLLTQRGSSPDARSRPRSQPSCSSTWLIRTTEIDPTVPHSRPASGL
jgi:4-amino-4-deoxy-L-arabinose transferase-like glycosyltransferase